MAKVTREFIINSTDQGFDCTQLDRLRSVRGAFPGEYSCQGKTLPAGGFDSASQILRASVDLLAALAFISIAVSL
jgi:hypothetical protein